MVCAVCMTDGFEQLQYGETGRRDILRCSIVVGRKETRNLYEGDDVSYK